MVKRVILGDEFALFLYDFIKNNKFNKIFKFLILTTTSLVVFTLVMMLLVVGIVSLLKHISSYEVLMGVLCVSYSFVFILTFIKKIIYLVKIK